MDYIYFDSIYTLGKVIKCELIEVYTNDDGSKKYLAKYLGSYILENESTVTTLEEYQKQEEVIRLKEEIENLKEKIARLEK